MRTLLARTAFVAVLTLVSFTAFAQVSVTTLGSTYNQEFDALATSGTANPWVDNTTIVGWYAQFTAVATNPTTYRAEAGAGNAGAIYSYGTGTATERAFGSIGSAGTGDVVWAVRLVNNTGATITSLDVSYVGEQWRAGGCTLTPPATTCPAQTVDFQYQVANAGTITDANTPATGWTDHNALDFTSPAPGGASAAALDGNSAANRTALSSTITVNVAPGQEVWLRWVDINHAGNDHGLAIDSFNLTPQGTTTPSLGIGDVTAVEGNAGTTTFTFNVTLSAPAGPGGVTFDIATADGTATAGSDYVAKSLTGQTIPAGSTTYAFDVVGNGDGVIEPNETFFVNVTNITGATAGDTQGQGTIQNDDSPPVITINDVTVTEGNTGTTTATFTVSLSSPAQPGGVTFDIATADGTAAAGTDYVARNLTGQTIVAGATSYSFDVTVNGDTSFESTETFAVNITNIVGATAGDTQGTGTITNDDAAPTVSIADVAVTEGNAGTQTLTFTATLSAASTSAASVDVATADGSATVANGDYVANSMTLNFAPGTTTQTFNVTINSDVVAEGDENLFVNLSNPVGLTISDNQALGTIRNDDPFSIAAVNTPYSENFNVLASAPTTADVFSSTTPVGWTFSETGTSGSVGTTYRADEGGANAGDTYSYGSTASTDRAFGTLSSGTLTPIIGAFYQNNTGVPITTLSISYTGEQWRLGASGRTDRLDFQYSTDATSLTTGTWVNVNNLDFNAPNSTGTTTLDGNLPANRTAVSFTITGLSIPTGATFWVRFTDPDVSGSEDGLGVDDFTIIANISGGVLSINDALVTEGNAGPVIATFTVTLSSPAGVGGVSFDIATADGTATAADNDYVPQALTGQVIPEGQTTYTFNVTVNGDTQAEPSETFFVNVTNIGGAAPSDTQGLGTIASDDFTILRIHEVQGAGNQSPRIGQTVTVSGVVTGIKTGGSGGFFVQEEDLEVDTDPNTSEGIFVFTGGSVPAGVVIGNVVAVTGVVSEFPTSAIPHSVTELTNATVSPLGTAPLPTPAVITAADAVPSANLSHYERFEGMRVSTTLTVVAPTDGNINEPNATSTSNGVFYGIPTGGARPFREPGHDLDTPIPSDAPSPGTIPRFDTNPEKLRVDSDNQPGATQLNVAAGQTVSNLVGVLDYGFFEYTLLPEAATVPVVTGPAAATPVPAQLASELTVASFNLQRFYDTVDFTSPTPNAPGTGDTVITAAALNNRLIKASLAIRTILRSPDVIGVVEVENLATLQLLADRINSDSVAAGQPNPMYQAYLEEGNDIGGIDVGFLVKASRVNVISVTQLGKTTTFTDPSDGSTDTLNDRPPLMLLATINRTDGTPYPFTVIVNHLRSLNNAADDTPAGRRIRAKRAAQAEYLANLVQARQTANPAERIILVGDFNAFQFSDGLVDVIGTIKGTPTPANQVVVASPDLVNPDLTNLVDLIPADQRYSYVFEGNAQVLDHALVTQAFLPDLTRVLFAHLDADYPEIFRNDITRPERISDHDAIVAYFNLAAPIVVASADLAVAKSAPVSTTAGANLQFTITVTNNGPSAATNVVVTDTLPAGTTFVSATPTQGSCTGTTTVTCTVGSLASGATATVTLVTTATGATPVVNTATVSAAEADPNPANNTSTTSTSVVAVIPTMSEWMLIALAMALVAFGAVRLKV